MLSFLANILPERVIYNVGWIKTEWWEYDSSADADEEFKHTAAHEIGHEILKSYGGQEYSYRHRGSSFLVMQDPLPVGQGGLPYPTTGEIDLMKYYVNSQPFDIYVRTVASDVDVYSLLWLARIKFDD